MKFSSVGFLAAIAILAGSAFSNPAIAENAAPAITAEQVALVPWNSDESASRLARSKHKADFFTLANNFTSQENGAVCGLASAAIVLNSLRLGKKEGLPVDKSSISDEEGKYLQGYNPYFEKYTQRNLFKEGAKSKN